MFKHVLIATDGSQLSEKAALSAVQLAKSMSARLTAVTASTPFHTFATDTVMLSDTEKVYMEKCERQAEKFLRVIKTAAESSPSEAGCIILTRHEETCPTHQSVIKATIMEPSAQVAV